MRAELLAFLTALLGIIAPVVRSYLLKNKSVILTHVQWLATQAVQAAEKVAVANSGNISSFDKYSIASRFLVDTAKRLGVKLTDTEVNTFIHAALQAAQFPSTKIAVA